MIHILLGPDDYSKKSFIAALVNPVRDDDAGKLASTFMSPDLSPPASFTAFSNGVKDQSADLVVYHQDDELPGALRLTETDLFSRRKVFVFDGVMPELQDKLEDLITSKNSIVISVESLDKRKKENKDLLANKDIIVKEFNLPHGMELNKWIENRVGELGGKIAKPAVDELAVRLGRDNAKEIKVAGKVISTGEVYSLWQADSEIKKLMAYAQGRQIEIEDVQAIVPENLEVDAFEIINAISEGKKSQALNLMQKFLRADSASDEKTAVIHLNALLSDQMRSLAITQDFIKSKISDTEIIKRTAWKSGRLYIMKKLAGRLRPQKVLTTLPKLEALDEELKTSQTSPRVLLDMILAQIF